MRKLLASSPLPAGLAAALALTGCVADAPALSSNEGESFEAFRERTFREPLPGGVYIVDGDTPIADDQALYQYWAARQQGALAVYVLNNTDIKWTPAQRLNLTYCISDAFGTNKAALVTAMREATELGWERFADVNFRYLPSEDANCTSSNANVLFDINPVTGVQYLARAFFPNAVRAQRNVLVAPESFSPTLSVPLKGIMAHELGHVLGFRHEHIRGPAVPQGCVEDNQYRGVTAYDQLSVMHYPQCAGDPTSKLAFTALDQQGVAALYGAVVAAPVAQVTAPAVNATVGADFEVTSSVLGTEIVKVELRIDGVLKNTLTAAPYTFPITALTPGAHTLELKAYDSRDRVSTDTRMVTVRGAGGNNGSNGNDGDGADDEITGGCQSSHGSSTAALGLLLGALLLRRRRAR